MQPTLFRCGSPWALKPPSTCKFMCCKRCLRAQFFFCFFFFFFLVGPRHGRKSFIVVVVVVVVARPRDDALYDSHGKMSDCSSCSTSCPCAEIDLVELTG